MGSTRGLFSSAGSGSPAPESGTTVRRMVAGLTDATMISTGWPATTMGPDWPRMMAGASASPAPAEPSRVIAARRDTRMAHPNREGSALCRALEPADAR
jgi:hypothetical protein